MDWFAGYLPHCFTHGGLVLRMLMIPDVSACFAAKKPVSNETGQSMTMRSHFARACLLTAASMWRDP